MFRSIGIHYRTGHRVIRYIKVDNIIRIKN